MNELYDICLKGYKGLWHLTEELRNNFNRADYDIVLKQYGLKTGNNNFFTYQVVDDELFVAFLLEYSDQLIVVKLK